MTREEYNTNVDLWADSAYRFAHRCCKDDEFCKDAVQDAFTSLWEHRNEVSSHKGKQWLLSAVHNRLMSIHRHLKVANDSIENDSSPPTIEPDVGFDLKEAINRALDSLPPLQKECLQLRDVEGYHYKEIAQILHITDQQVQVYIFRARVALQKQLKEFRS